MKPIGYQELIRRFGLDVLTPPVTSYALGRNVRATKVFQGHREEHYPPREEPGPEWTDQLGFALKHEGVNLEVLAALFRSAPQKELARWVSASPTGRYTRIAWFLFEWLRDQKLPIPDATQGNYVAVLDDAEYYALPRTRSSLNSRRHRVVTNLPGTREYCPLVRRTEALRDFEDLRLDEEAATRLRDFPGDVLARAVEYLYLKETKSSFAIEHQTPDQRRAARFVALLRQAGSLNCYTTAELTRLQNVIVEDRYAAKGFRTSQNYVGQSLGPGRELVHYVAPRPHDVPGLMDGWMECCRRMQAGGIHPVVTAAVAGFGFVFLHPFEDGNGRLHRFLIHHALTMGGFVPTGGVFPISATMLKHSASYDAVLEAYSREVGQHVEFDIDDRGAMEVKNDSASFYRYPDLTIQTEALFGFIRTTIDQEMMPELEYLVAFDAARQQIKRLVDMPDRRLDLFIRLCVQGRGHISRGKRREFSELSDKETAALETIVGREILRRQEDPGT